MNETFKILVLLIIGLLLISFFLSTAFYEREECHQRGGVFLRGAIGWECLVVKE